mmetsp:Transcript_3387/g.7089  ORF Transcript_3387/g.7089 Transcript_3387/m.7089 type:complete len:401 (-) Transcript_3387:22-1224(-)
MIQSTWLFAALASLLFASRRAFVSADIVIENDLINPEEIFDFVVLQDSSHWWLSPNSTHYFCIMRGLWNPFNHPKKYPNLARMSNPIMYSSTKQYMPWLINRATTWGVEKIAETGFTDTFKIETKAAGDMINDIQEGRGFFIDQEDPEKNYAYMPGIKVTPDFPFLSGLAGMSPTPDWFTGFYLLDVIDEYDRTFWNRMIIHTYPWDAGTDDGDTYMSVDQDLDPPKAIQRITPKNAPNGIFLSPDGREVRPVAEWDCALHVCEEGEEYCEPDNWPPENGCDMLKYPGCETECDPGFDPVCEECQPKPKPIILGAAPESEEDNRVFYRNCCQSNHEPLEGKCVPGWIKPEDEGKEGGSTKKDKPARKFFRPFYKGAAASHFSPEFVATVCLMAMGLMVAF